MNFRLNPAMTIDGDVVFNATDIEKVSDAQFLLDTIEVEPCHPSWASVKLSVRCADSDEDNFQSIIGAKLSVHEARSLAHAILAAADEEETLMKAAKYYD